MKRMKVVTPDSPAEPEVLAVGRAVARLGGRRRLYDELLSLYAETSQGAEQAIALVVRKRDYKAARHEAHKQKQSFHMIGADACFAALGEFEDKIAKRDAEDVEKAWEKLAAEMRKLSERVAEEMGVNEPASPASGPQSPPRSAEYRVPAARRAVR